MNHFDYRNGVLHAEAVNLIDLADAVGTPFYCYSTATLERHYRVFTEAFAGENALVCYAMKANSNQAVLRLLAGGHGPTEIGERLHVSVKTVSTHKARILEKLCLHSTAELVRYAIENGLLED